MNRPTETISTLISRMIAKDLAGYLPLFNRPLRKEVYLERLVVPVSDHFWKIAEKNRLGHLLAETLLIAPDNIVTEERRAALVEQGAKIDLYLKELRRLADVFQEASIPVLVLENGGLAFGVHRVSSNYSFGDFDLLLAVSDLHRAHVILAQHGYRCLTATDSENATGFDLGGGRLEFLREFAGGQTLTLNIQTAFVARRWLFSGKEPDFASLLLRSRRPCSGAVHILGREDFLLQLCLHNAAHSYLRRPGIRLHLDVDWYLRCVGEEVDWHNFVKLATEMNAKTVVYLSLIIPQVILNSPVPQEVLTVLAPGRTKARLLAGILSKGDLLAPQKSQFRRWRFILFTLLTYDDLASVVRAIIPTREYLVSRCGLVSAGSRARFLLKHYLKAVLSR